MLFFLYTDFNKKDVWQNIYKLLLVKMQEYKEEAYGKPFDSSNAGHY